MGQPGRVGSGGDLLVETLARRGVECIFGFPGDTSIALYDALQRRPESVRHILARDERHAGFMADAYTRTTGRLGVCEASSGAGAVYLASGLGEALASSIPILAITTDNSTLSAGTSAISEVDQDALFAACTKWRKTAGDVSQIPALVDEAIKVANAGRPGPAALIIPENVLETLVDLRPSESAALDAVVRSEPSVADAATLAAARDLLATSERPCIVAGGGLHLSQAWPQLRQLAERGAIPVATTIHGKGALDEGHPLALGVMGSNGARPYANSWVTASDCVVFVGTRANGTDTLSFTVPPRDGSVQTIHIDKDADRAGRNYPEGLPLIGDAAGILAQLADLLPPANETICTTRWAELADARTAWCHSHDDRSSRADEETLHPREVTMTLASVLGGDTWVTADAGTPTPYLSCYWEAPGDGWRVVIPRGHGPMGYAIPAAIGVAIGHPGSRVLCLTTENSLAMAVSEWGTANRLGLPILFVVLDNVSMCWIKMIQHLYSGKRYFGVDPEPIDPVLLAQGMGLRATRAANLQQLARLTHEWKSAPDPYVVHVRVPEHMEAPPPVASWEAALSGQQLTRPIH